MEPLRHVLDPLALVIVAGGPLPLCLAGIAPAAGRDRGAADAWLALLTMWCALELALVLVLGMAGIYRAPAVLGGELALAAGGAALLTRRGTGLRAALRPLSIRNPLSGAERAIVASTVLVGTVFLVRLATRPIVDFDSLWYHLPNMAVWYRTGTFAMMDGTGRPVVEQVLRYPYDWEALSSLFLFPFRDDFLVSVPKLVSWAILGLAVHRLAVRIGARRVHGLAAASLAGTVPFLLFDLNTLRIDVPFAAFFVAGAWYALAAGADRSRRDLALALLAVGLLSGTKMTGPIYAALVGFAGVAARWSGRRRSAPEPGGGAAIVVSAALFALLAGGFWYARNWLEVGNPLGYVRIDLGGRTILPGDITIEMIQRTSLARMFDATDPAHWRTLLTQIAVRLQLPFVLLAAQAVLVPRAFAATRGDSRRALLVVVVVLTVASGLLFWAHTGTGAQGFSSRTLGPFLGQGFRYGFGFLGLLAVVAAAAATGAGTSPRLAAAAALAGALTGVLSGTMSEAIKTASFGGYGPEWASGLLDRLGAAPGAALGELARALKSRFADVLLPTLAWAGGTAALIRWSPPWPGRRRWIVAAVLLPLALGLGHARRDAARRVLYGGVPEWISANVPPGGTVAYAFSVYSYLFHGTDLRADVAYVPATSGDEGEWLDALRARGASVVGLGPSMGPRRSPEEIAADVRELRWLEREGARWERVVGGDLGVTPWLWRRTAP